MRSAARLSRTHNQRWTTTSPKSVNGWTKSEHPYLASPLRLVPYPSGRNGGVPPFRFTVGALGDRASSAKHIAFLTCIARRFAGTTAWKSSSIPHEEGRADLVTRSVATLIVLARYPFL